MHSHPSIRALTVACSSALLALWPLGTSAQPRSDLQVGSVGDALQAAGYTVSTPMVWHAGATVFEAHAPDGVHIVRAFVYRDAETAAAAHRQAYAQLATPNGSVPDSNDAGPQLLSGYGASAWRGNVALVQSSPDTFAELTPAEDCWSLNPPSGPDLSQHMYRVDASLVARLDDLTGR